MKTIDRRQLLLGSAAFVATASLSATSGLLAACEVTPSDSPDRQKILSDLARIVIVPSYEDASARVAALSSAVDKLASTPEPSALASAQDAWRLARASWKKTDAFLFGPADDLALTHGAIDSGPPDVAKLEALIAATSTLDATTVASLGGNQRGFVGLEAMLFDPTQSADAIAAGFAGGSGERRRALTSFLARDLRAKVDAVRDAWLPGKGDYASALSLAGRGSKAYAAERQAIDAVVNALASAAEILIALRLAKPLGLDRTPVEAHPELVESGRSDASLADIVSVLEGIEMTYLGTRDGLRGVALGDAVHQFRADGDVQLRKAIPAAKEAVLAIPPPLRSAVSANRDPAMAAHAAIRDIKRLIVTDVAGALGTTVGFGVTDGD